MGEEIKSLVTNEIKEAIKCKKCSGNVVVLSIRLFVDCTVSEGNLGIPRSKDVSIVEQTGIILEAYCANCKNGNIIVMPFAHLLKELAERLIQETIESGELLFITREVLDGKSDDTDTSIN